MAVPSDKDKIITEIKNVAALVEVKKQEFAIIEVLTESKEVSDFFSENTFISVLSEDFKFEKSISKDEIKKHFIAAKKQLKKLDVKLSNFDIEITQDRALARFFARAIFSVQGDSNLYKEEANISATLEKDSGRWVFIEIEVKN